MTVKKMITMAGKHSVAALMLMIVIGMMCSCKPSVPRRYIQPDDLEDILYDYYVAQAMAEQDGDENSEYTLRMYKTAVLNKHGVSEAEFDSTMVYYTRHSDRLHRIYRNLVSRMEADAVSLGADAREISSYGAGISSGDTANIWPLENSLTLMPAMPYNIVSFDIPADTSYHKGDKVIWSFDTKFMYQEGQKNAVAMLVLKYDNDSVVSRTKSLTSSTHYTLELPKTDTLALKEVKGFICLLRNANATTTTLKLLFVNNIRMVKSAVQRNKTAARADVVKKDEHAADADSVKRRSEDTTKVKTATAGKPEPLIKKKPDVKPVPKTAVSGKTKE